jgi:hypothetical protein
MKIAFTKTSTTAGLLVLATGLCAALNVQAGKPAPPPAKPAAITYEKVGIWGMAADGSSQRARLANTTKTAYRNPCISPDGTTIAFFRVTTTTELCLANLNGTGLVVVHTFAPTDPAPAYWFVTWSPEGSKLLFSSQASDGGLFYVDLGNPGVIQSLVVGLGFSGPMSLSGDPNLNVKSPSAAVRAISGTRSWSWTSYLIRPAHCISGTLWRPSPWNQLFTRFPGRPPGSI